MTTNRKFVFLGLLFALIVTIAWYDYRKRATVAKLVELGDVSMIEMTFHGKSASLQKEADHWRLSRFEGQSAADFRVNEDMINHLVDLIRALSVDGDKLEPRDAPAYGMKQPELSVTLSWTKPAAGRESVLFGHRDLSEKRVFAFFPDRPLLVEVPAYAIELLSNKEPLDIRDRRITTFDLDDVEDLVTRGKCGQFKLSRDGDHWLREGRAIRSESAERWLDRLLTTRYDDIVEQPKAGDAEAHRNPVCEIELVGRRNRTETILIYKSDGTLWANNTRLPSLYHLPAGVMRALIPPR